MNDLPHALDYLGRRIICALARNRWTAPFIAAMDACEG
jgi:hypothetical protein